MSVEVQCTTQAEIEAALAAGNIPLLIGDGWFTIRSGAPKLVARESSRPHVVAQESSRPHVEAWGSSQPHVVAWGSSQPHVEAWESSQPHVVAWAYTQLSVSGGVIVQASENVAVLTRGDEPNVTGGKVTRWKWQADARWWCDYYGVPVRDDGTVILFKAVRQDFRSEMGEDYSPGLVPRASDWDGGEAECGGGLHFCPHPALALTFDTKATRFVACPVALSDIAVHEKPTYPSKVKAAGCCAPTWECDRFGRPVAPK